nr:Pr6Pr family membrane protein [Microbacterium ulmi]
MTGERRLAFYTTQSNLIVVAFFAVVTYWMIREGTTDAPAPRLRGGVTLWIAVTGLVSHVILNQGANPLPGLFVTDAVTVLDNRSLFLLHYVVPAMVLVDWVVFGPHGIVRWRDGLLWLLYPVAYGAIAIVRGVAFPTVSDRFPYPFLDVEALGGGIVWALTRIVAVIVVLAAAVIALDRASGLVKRRLRLTARIPDAAAADA